MLASTISITGVTVPRLLYGTAWKEEQTETLTALALAQGFRGVDTANQRQHYYEAGVGAAIGAAIEQGLVAREELFLQTKFTFRPGQDHRLPYDPAAPVAEQVRQSFASSLAHLGVEVIDSYVLHGPARRVGLGEDDWAAWRAMEEMRDSGRARLLGVSNVQLDQLEQLYRQARIKPSFVQNRCFAVNGWDRDMRAFCSANGIVYQGFSLLTANVAALNQGETRDIAQRHQRTIAQIAFRFALDVGMIVLTGTTSPQHMQEDLDVFDFELSREEVDTIERLAMQ